jgi:hypothetical protein
MTSNYLANAGKKTYYSKICSKIRMISHCRTYPLVSVGITLRLSRVHASSTLSWTFPTLRFILISVRSATETSLSGIKPWILLSAQANPAGRMCAWWFSPWLLMITRLYFQLAPSDQKTRWLCWCRSRCLGILTSTHRSNMLQMWALCSEGKKMLFSPTG